MSASTPPRDTSAIREMLRAPWKTWSARVRELLEESGEPETRADLLMVLRRQSQASMRSWHPHYQGSVSSQGILEQETRAALYEELCGGIQAWSLPAVTELRRAVEDKSLGSYACWRKPALKTLLRLGDRIPSLLASAILDEQLWQLSLDAWLERGGQGWEALLPALDGPEAVRAARSIAMLGGRDAVGVLTERLDPERPKVLIELARVLRYEPDGRREVVLALRRAVERPWQEGGSPSVRAVLRSWVSDSCWSELLQTLMKVQPSATLSVLRWALLSPLILPPEEQSLELLSLQQQAHRALEIAGGLGESELGLLQRLSIYGDWQGEEGEEPEAPRASLEVLLEELSCSEEPQLRRLAGALWTRSPSPSMRPWLESEDRLSAPQSWESARALLYELSLQDPERDPQTLHHLPPELLRAALAAGLIWEPSAACRCLFQHLRWGHESLLALFAATSEGMPAWLEPVSEVLQTPSLPVAERRMAAMILKRLCESSAELSVESRLHLVLPLRRALGDEDPLLRLRAEGALEALEDDYLRLMRRGGPLS